MIEWIKIPVIFVWMIEDTPAKRHKGEYPFSRFATPKMEATSTIRSGKINPTK